MVVVQVIALVGILDPVRERDVPASYEGDDHWTVRHWECERVDCDGEVREPDEV